MSKLSDLIARGVLASRPAAGSAGRLYEATDTTPPTVYRDNGSSWDTYATAGAATVTTTRGDLIVRGSSADVRLALGAAGKILTSDGTDAVWGNGPMTTKGDLLAGGASGAISRLGVGTDGQVLTADAASTPGVKWAAAAGGGGSGGGDVEKAYAQITSTVTITGTTQGAPTDVVAAPAFTADGSSTYMIEFYSPFYRVGASALTFVDLWLDGSVVGHVLLAGSGSIADHYDGGAVLRWKVTPAAGSRTYSIKAYRATANGEVGAGTGTAGDYAPAYIRITQLAASVGGNGRAVVATDQSTASGSFVDLTTAGPSVTITVNTKCMVILSADMYGSAAGCKAVMGVDISGANTVAAADNPSLGTVAYDNSNNDIQHSRVCYFSGLTPGSTTFKAQYYAAGGTAHFRYRELLVVLLD